MLHSSCVPPRHLDRAGQRRHRRDAGCRGVRRCGQRHAGQHRAAPALAPAESVPPGTRQYQAARGTAAGRGAGRDRSGAARWPLPARTPPRAIGRWPASIWRSRFRFSRTVSRARSWTNSSGASAARTLGNKAASGTEIIKELGAEHMRTGSPIVYTSADSVFQVAAHEEVIPLWELYKICETAREILRGPYEVGRVIARPFEGSPGSFTRTANRNDYAVPPPRGMLLDELDERGRCECTASARSSTCFWGAASAITRRPRTTPTAWRRRWKRCDRSTPD